MKGIEKLTSVRLAEILTERAIVPGEAISDALYSQERQGEPFAQVLINGGHITEWDLSKIVAESFNLPFMMAGNYQLEETAKERLPKETLFEYMIVPLDVFDDIVIVSMPVIMPFEQIMKVQKKHSCELFPYVGLISENKRILSEMHKDYPKWLEEEQQRREVAAKQRAVQPTGQDGDWMSIFDAGDQAIKATKKPD
ncbi:MAG: hypothetical protein KDE27_10390 [Planctomycetes bacterium]|nr:hypothetical protein [Planctomycetota bacterium]